ncbi:hypothetical protein TTHERM_00062660 (macronuclear) [Tetrahymena thermophila SB210]|uniref:Uncharacterized protein n=1 Tax=Tetrahymena thermophila (strain SB210) TaxID=312017 RepID=I7LTX2_TETTS|nr:hypothetical protein TTHERM_00062660 [Tetrahymena thermophila SB210]EAR87456.2 hypothetical protein TTHERM_00062660 [Tetrahymena thermophila SB210]|eukprot:XP_001007701.2 hypothetical protein TTHERM_00062660 [Tetrahymena thermophila SB210]
MIKTLGYDNLELEKIYKQFFVVRQQREQINQKLEQLGNLEKNLHKKWHLNKRNNEFDTYFNSDYCSVFVSLTNKLGQIKQVSTNFEKIVPVLNNKEIVGKNISVMQPSLISEVHDKILIKYLNKSVTQQTQSNFDLILGVDNQGFAVAYQIKVQTYLKGDQDFGICALIRQIPNSNQYILLLQNQNFEVLTLSQSLYLDLFQQYISYSHIKEVYLSKIIPAFPLIFLNCQLNPENSKFQTLIILPRNKQQYQYIQNITIKEENVFDILDYEFCRVQGELVCIRNEFISVIQCIISEVKKINKKNEVIEEIANLQKYLQQNQDIKKQYKKNKFKYKENQLLECLLQNYSKKYKESRYQDSFVENDQDTKTFAIQYQEYSQRLDQEKQLFTTESNTQNTPRALLNFNTSAINNQLEDYIQEENTKEISQILSPISTGRSGTDQRIIKNNYELESNQLRQIKQSQQNIDTSVQRFSRNSNYGLKRNTFTISSDQLEKQSSNLNDKQKDKSFSVFFHQQQSQLQSSNQEESQNKKSNIRSNSSVVLDISEAFKNTEIQKTGSIASQKSTNSNNMGEQKSNKILIENQKVPDFYNSQKYFLNKLKLKPL